MLPTKFATVQGHGDIQRWLSPATALDDLQNHSSDYMPGSCDWFLGTEEFSRLISSPKSRVLRILGRPGEGKTMLASFIINYVLEHTSNKILYFFCKAGDAEKRLPIHVIRTFLSQLLRHFDNAYSSVETSYHNSGRQTADSFNEVCAAFNNVLSTTSTQSQMLIIIDAIDECCQPQQLIKTLRSCQSVASRPLHLLLTTRDNPELRSLFDLG